MAENIGEIDKDNYELDGDPIVRVNVTLSVYRKAWDNYKKRWGLTDREVATEMLAALQVRAWADVFEEGELQPIITHEEKCPIDPALREHFEMLKKMRQQNKGK